MRKICLRCGSKFGSKAEYCPHDGSLLATDEEIADPLLGAVLLEQFRVEQQIGVGGMGTVYRAHQTTIDRDVAIKVLRPELARDEQAVARFEREARLCTSLDHPNLVRVFLSGRLPDGRLYIVMELLEGRSLSDELDEQGPPSLERAVIMIMKLCAGLGAVHAAGIVHRDIKPENVYLVRRGRDNDFVKLVDFGVARVLAGDGVGPTTTQNGRVFGTATYISPEAATGDETDHRSDIYSLGVLSYQLLTGELPFEGTTAGSVLMQHVHNEPPPLHTKGRGTEVPHDVARVVMRALRKEPEARQQTLAELLDSLAEAAGNAGLLADARGLLLGTVWGDELAAPGSYLAALLGSSQPSSLPPAFDETQPVALGRDPKDEALLSSAPKPFGTTAHDLAPAPRRQKRSHRGLWAVLGLLAVVLIGVVAGAWFRRQASKATAAKPDPIAAPAAVEEEEPPIVDVGTNVPVLEPEVLESAVVVEEPPAVEEEPAPPPPIPKAKKKKKRKKPKEAVPSSAPAPAPAPDDGIDWSVPDFPDEPTPALESVQPADPPAPTGTPDAPPRNPVVIDEVP
ncbi:MAG: protein kinase [Polyangiales bacterium]